MNYLPTCTSRLVVQHPCQVLFKSMQGCRRSWEDKLKCVKNRSVKDQHSAKICRTWIISPHALLDFWCNIPAKFHSNPCKDVGGVEKTNFDGTEWRNNGRTEGQNDGMTEGRTKQTLNAPLPFYGGGIKTTTLVRDHEYFIPTKFHQNPSRGSGEEVENVKSLRTTTTDGRTDGVLWQ